MTRVVLDPLTRVPRSTSNEEIISLVARDGGVVIEGFLEPGVVAAFNSEIDPFAASREPGSLDTTGSDVSWGNNTKRLTNMIVRSQIFREHIVADNKLLDLAAMQLHGTCDQFWMNTTQLVDIGPGSPAQTLHRDMENYPAFLPMGPSGPEVMCNFLYALTEFTEENGATRIIPGSHTWNDYTQRGTSADTVPVVLQPGDVLFFSGKLAHGGGGNTTANEWRRALLIPFNPGWLVPEEAYPFMIDIETAQALPERVQQLIGFRSFYNTVNNGGQLWTADYESLAAYLGLD
ncbi:phytanoyl-CoA dioxygenase family protein [Mycolicibacterium baixiangningiae]|uniref:phytanoyl-CoA dioxygenase family protein n=1 Tax=Mycolicibacterium baixiangningiae TaxID=2761578 RepID=UPI001867B549|nr:phytanoyl-CoA dioxygenase family protein [Mycolicibacterium baixiangningiae]